jgi:fructose-1,6-bisphosphatase/inositol monophosphatase family enzyme
LELSADDVLKSADSQRVAELMRETAATELSPRFRALAKEDIRLKGPGDYVTVADVAAEQRLAAGLAKILPGVPIVGEEAVEKEPGLVDLIARPGESCWVVDPLDGTANFASGTDRYAIIVCLVHDQKTIGGWILDVPRGHMAVALKGEGVTLDGVPVRRSKPARPPIGFVGYKISKEFDRQLPATKRSSLGRVSTLRCAAAEYIEILAGRADFNLYRVTKPWDHAAGSLMVAEAGGDAQRFDGKAYGPAQPLNSGLIAAINPQTLVQVRTLLEEVRMPLLAGLPKG